MIAVTVSDVTISLLAGMVGAAILRIAEAIVHRRNERRELRAILRLLRDELRHNIAVFHALGELGLNPRDVEPMTTEIYDRYQADLARLLPQDLRWQVAHLYYLLRRGASGGLQPAASDETATWFRTSARHSKSALVGLDGALAGLMKKLSSDEQLELGPVELTGSLPQN
jgi:hypothetical protein